MQTIIIFYTEFHHDWMSRSILKIGKNGLGVETALVDLHSPT